MSIFAPQAVKNPPVKKVQILLWCRDNLFSNFGNTMLTIAIIAALFAILPPLLSWLIFDANFVGESSKQCTGDGACWIYIDNKIKLFIYGFYPEESYWRVHLSLLLVGLIFAIVKLIKEVQLKRLILLISFIIYPIIAFFLLSGGFGLEVVKTDQWGGLLLTMVIASTGIVAALPIGILLALGRLSDMPIVRYFSIIYIEFIRGVPLISILFMASVVLPLFFASGTELDKLLRALIGISLFQAAYVAEIIRGGLQSIPKGQFEAADSLGLNYWQKITFIVMPQVLKVSIPNLTGSCIGLFKDTTLVLIIGLFDMLAMVRLTSSDTDWLGLETEGYVFVTLVFWVFLYNMSRASRRLEQRFNTEY